jgi:hypothetical protein
MTGALPFPVVSREAWRQAVLSGQCTPLGHHLPDPSTRLVAFFDRCFATDAGRRPASARELLQDLERAVAP